jgi:glucokinase
MRYAVGMDVGGSSARAALVAEDGEVVSSAAQPTGFDTPRDTLMQRLRNVLDEALEPARARGLSVEGVGIGMPGLQDTHGRVDSASNLPQLNGMDVRGEISRWSGLPAAMENDLNAVALGEYHFGGHRVAGNLLVIAVGTGVGAALLQGGRLLRVARGCLGDPGHVLVEPGGRACRCGAHGCLEAHLAGWALLEQAAEAGIAEPDSRPLTPAALFAQARQGHPAVRDLIERAAAWFGMGLASFGALYQPEGIVLGGNVLIEGADLLLPRASAVFRALVQPWMAHLELPLSRIPQTAGVLGGAALILNGET